MFLQKWQNLGVCIFFECIYSVLAATLKQCTLNPKIDAFKVNYIVLIHFITDSIYLRSKMRLSPELEDNFFTIAFKIPPNKSFQCPAKHATSLPDVEYSSSLIDRSELSSQVREEIRDLVM